MLWSLLNSQLSQFQLADCCRKTTVYSVDSNHNLNGLQREGLLISFIFGIQTMLLLGSIILYMLGFFFCHCCCFFLNNNEYIETSSIIYIKKDPKKSNKNKHRGSTEKKKRISFRHLSLRNIGLCSLGIKGLGWTFFGSVLWKNMELVMDEEAFYWFCLSLVSCRSTHFFNHQQPYPDCIWKWIYCSDWPYRLIRHRRSPYLLLPALFTALISRVRRHSGLGP